MNEVKFPINLPKSKYELYIRYLNNGCLDILSKIHKLGNLCTYDQFIRIYTLKNEQYTKSYNEKKARNIIKDMEKMKLIECNQINSYKYFCIKNSAITLISNNLNKPKQININKLLKNNNFKINLLRVEHYIKSSTIISLSNLNEQLLAITQKIYSLVKNDPKLKAEYDFDLLSKILNDKGITNCINKVSDLPYDNLIKILWMDIYNIFNNLRLQNQTIDTKPFYYKMYKQNNKLILHYVPNIIIFDVHDKKYYIKKVNDLHHKFFNINTNNPIDMVKSYKNNNTLGFKGHNHFAYVVTLIGMNPRELVEKKKAIDSSAKNFNDKDNPNSTMLDSCIKYVDISKYFRCNADNSEVLNKIDSKFDMLLKLKTEK